MATSILLALKKALGRVLSLAGSVCIIAGGVCIRVSKKIYQSPQEKRFAPWFRDNGPKTLRLDYALDDNSLVFDIGGYEGQWASDIFSKYCCTIYIFEPIIEFADKIERRFSPNKKILIHRFGLSNKTVKAMISLAQDSSSIFKKGRRTVEISLVRAADFIRDNNIRSIDLMKINIEGGEYDLLEHLIDSGLTRRIKNIQIQFHDFVPGAEKRMKRIQRELENTHQLTYQYPFVFENWRIKDDL